MSHNGHKRLIGNRGFVPVSLKVHRHTNVSQHEAEMPMDPVQSKSIILSFLSISNKTLGFRRSPKTYPSSCNKFRTRSNRSWRQPGARNRQCLSTAAPPTAKKLFEKQQRDAEDTPVPGTLHLAKDVMITIRINGSSRRSVGPSIPGNGIMISASRIESQVEKFGSITLSS